MGALEVCYAWVPKCGTDTYPPATLPHLADGYPGSPTLYRAYNNAATRNPGSVGIGTTLVKTSLADIFAQKASGDWALEQLSASANTCCQTLVIYKACQQLPIVAERVGGRLTSRARLQAVFMQAVFLHRRLMQALCMGGCTSTCHAGGGEAR